MNRQSDSGPIPVESVELLRLEGPTDYLPQRFASFVEAESWLSSLANTFPESGYDKFHFCVTWANGDAYEGRFDAVSPASAEFAGYDLSRVIKRTADFIEKSVPYRPQTQRGEDSLRMAKRLLNGEFELPSLAERPAPEAATTEAAVCEPDADLSPAL